MAGELKATQIAGTIFRHNGYPSNGILRMTSVPADAVAVPTITVAGGTNVTYTCKDTPLVATDYPRTALNIPATNAALRAAIIANQPDITIFAAAADTTLVTVSNAALVAAGAGVTLTAASNFLLRDYASEKAASYMGVFSSRRTVDADDATMTIMVFESGLATILSYDVRVIISAVSNLTKAWDGNVTVSGGRLIVGQGTGGGADWVAANVVVVTAVGTIA